MRVRFHGYRWTIDFLRESIRSTQSMFPSADTILGVNDSRYTRFNPSAVAGLHLKDDIRMH